MLLSFFFKRDILKELYREKKITAEEYLTRLKRVYIVTGFFMILGSTLIDYFALPRFWDT